ncbi:hypothetical protein [Microvirga sp. G4-2]|uniref:hypothetical protein n=1 Tax=Microvirga sp. G4-2 TaxID=3434467 RepID=UPI0040449678
MRQIELYPVPLDQAYDVADGIQLPGLVTTIESTPYWGYLCANPADAARFVERFGAARYPTVDPAVFLMVTSAPDVTEDWYDEIKVEMTLVEFGAVHDQHRFELALW